MVTDYYNYHMVNCRSFLNPLSRLYTTYKSIIVNISSISLVRLLNEKEWDQLQILRKDTIGEMNLVRKRLFDAKFDVKIKRQNKPTVRSQIE